jgi:cytoplasmic iron level regulating protein YaaA (DUF328/UPF0246 family)
MYSGDVYNGIDAYSLNTPEQAYAQKNLLIISGLYGLIRPLDAIQPYRLEMRLPITASNSTDLYDYWRGEMSNYFTKKHDEIVLVCASKEYAKAVLSSIPDSWTAITPRFMQETDSGLKEKGLFAKYARGALARWVVNNKICDPERLKTYAGDGFMFSEDLSTANEFIYIVPSDFSLKGRFIKK